ncbi:hypothetical protein N7495_003954 [Penicillium taxi]|uniref:uncharacterized protein n=1 Tax=Penicillium taxi TaxID=168475 RepID=UPI002544E2A6|nr:uncharacterized protein N7495_003954 [Penicillium taxi]KAJ5899210.1 hypothetical protein N7495_003954 [Penicillium taxi]
MASNSDAFESLRVEINANIVRKLLRQGEATAQFAPRGTSENVLLSSPTTLWLFFDSLQLSEIQIPDQASITKANLFRNIHERNLYTFLAILIFSHCSFEAVRTFTIELLAKDENTWRMDVCGLPVKRKILQNLFGEENAEKFLRHQACFCPVVIGEQDLFTQIDLKEQRLPYLEEKLIIKKEIGQKAEIYAVIVAEGHFRYRDGNTNLSPKTIARKDYEVNEEQMGHETMKKILSADRRSENIIKIFGILDIGQGEYSLFMPLALCDLKAYMEDPHAQRVEKSDMINSARGVARGLEFLHHEMKSDGDDIVCYHMDLKPKNILIFPEKVNGKVYHVWKISDFGNSCVVIKSRRAAEVRDDSKTWFVQRRAREEQSQPGPSTVKQISSTYLGPESLFKNPSMNTSSDVWSLGCIISVVFTYMEEGREGVIQYANARMKRGRFDRFFQRDRMFLSHAPHPEVLKWHHDLIKQAEQRSRAEGEAVKSILKFVEERVLLLDQSRRCDVRDIVSELLKTQDMYRALENPPRTPTASEETQSSSSERPKKWRERLRRLPRAEPENKIRWSIKTNEYFGGCEISPLGSIIALWNDKKISLYTSEYAHSTGNGINEAAVAEPLEYLIDMSGCVWKSISLTDKYLVASVTSVTASGPSVEMCYIFKLHNSPVSSIPINFRLIRRVSMPSTVMKLVISSDNKTILCVLRENSGSLEKSSLYEIPVTQSGLEYRKLRTADWPAKEVTQLSFGPDYRSDATLFTTFAPFYRAPHTCTFVTREKRLEIASYISGPPERIHADINKYRVGKLMVTPDDRKFYALGKQSGRAPMILLELTIPRSQDGVEKVKGKEISQLPDWEYDEVTAKLSFSSEDNNHRILIVKKGKSEYEIFSIRLPGPNT